MMNCYKKEDPLPPCVYFTDSHHETKYRSLTQISRVGRKKNIWVVFDDMWEAYLHHEIFRHLEKLITSENVNDKRTKNMS